MLAFLCSRAYFNYKLLMCFIVILLMLLYYSFIELSIDYVYYKPGSVLRIISADSVLVTIFVSLHILCH